MARGAAAVVVAGLVAAAGLAGGGRAVASAGAAGGSRAGGAAAGLAYTTSQAGYAASGRYFRFAAVTVTVAPAAVPAGNASRAEVALTARAGDAMLSVASGGGAGSVTYAWPGGGSPAALSLAPAPGDVLALSVYYDQHGHDIFTAADLTQGISQTATVAVAPAIYFVAWAAAVVTNATVTPPAADMRLWEFSSCHLTTYTGVRGTLAGPWSIRQLIDTTTGLPGGFVVASAPVLWNSGQDFGAWLRARQLKLTAILHLNNQVGDIAVNPDTGAIYVAENNNTLSVISGQTDRVIAAVPAAGGTGVAVNPRTGTIYVANGYNAVLVINGQTNTVTATIPVAGWPYKIAVNPRTNTIYTTGIMNNTVSVISGQTNTVTATIPVGAAPESIAVNPATNTIYADNISGDTISVISGQTNTVIATIQPPTTPLAVALNPRTNTIYASLGGAIAVINGHTNMLTTTVTVGSGTQGLAVDPQTNTVYVADNADNHVSAIDGDTNTVIASVPVISFPLTVATNPQSNTIYVGNNYGGTMAVLTW